VTIQGISVPFRLDLAPVFGIVVFSAPVFPHRSYGRNQLARHQRWSNLAFVVFGFLAVIYFVRQGQSSFGGSGNGIQWVTHNLQNPVDLPGCRFLLVSVVH
jgi:hypothetical protein